MISLIFDFSNVLNSASFNIIWVFCALFGCWENKVLTKRFFFNRLFTPRRMFSFLGSKLLEIWISSHSFTSLGFSVRRTDAFDWNVCKIIQFLYHFRAAIIRSFHLWWLFIFLSVFLSSCLVPFVSLKSSFFWVAKFSLVIYQIQMKRFE